MSSELRPPWSHAALFLLVLLAAAHFCAELFSTRSGIVASMLLALSLFALLIRNWRRWIPVTASPWYRIPIVALVLIVLVWVIGDVTMLVDMRSSTGGGRRDGSSFGPLTSGAAGMVGAALAPGPVGAMRRVSDIRLLAVVLMAAVSVLELFLRGALYSLIQVRRSNWLALAISTLLYVLVLQVGIGGGWIVAAVTVVVGLALGLSRWASGSVVPAIVAQLVMAAKVVPQWTALRLW
jgi:membrane protease YdiL (CAAX protease family)